MKKFLFLLSITISVTDISAQNPTWEFLGLADITITDIAIDDSGNIYVSGEPWAVYKSSDNGATWVQKNNGITAYTGMALDIDSQGSIYLAALGGVFKTTNGGENWFRIAQNLSNLEFIEVTVIPNDYIFVSNFDGIHRSTDLGQTWFTSDYNLYGAGEIGINTNGVMFAGNISASSFSIYRSTNFGVNWIFAGYFATWALLFPNNGDVFAGVIPNPFTTNDIHKSTDNGLTWNRTYVFPPSSSVSYQDFELDKNGDFYVAISGGDFSGVHLSIDAGLSWSNYSFTLPTKCLSIDSSGYIYAATDDGIYRAGGRTVPVELISFTAEVNNDKVLLRWITATETNNQGFEVQRTEVRDQRSDWEKIGFVEGKGTTTEENIYNYEDNNIETGEYYYRLKQIDYDGSYEYSQEVQVKVDIIYDFNLEQNFPNPFNPGTIIKFSIPHKAFVSLSIYNSLGEKIKTIINEFLEEGDHSVELKAEDFAPSFSSGVYFYRLQADDYSESKKMLLLR